MKESFKIMSLGDTAVSCEFDNRIAPEVNRAVMDLTQAVRESKIPGILDLNPTYRALLITFDPCVIRCEELRKKILAASRKTGKGGSFVPKVFSIPVCYGGEFGEDLPFVAEHAGITPDEVIALHSAPEYLIYMLGFLPGFSYLGGLDKKIATPRLAQPRKAIPAGSVGIGGSQTGVYPLTSPGGWQLIGRTPVKPYDPRREEPILYRAGDYIHFVPVTRAEFDKIASDVEKGVYRVEFTRKEEAR